MIKKGEWVQVRSTVLTADERAPQVPEDTKEVPLVKLVKGYLNEDAEMGDEVEVTTVLGRTEVGELVVLHPVYTHTFGGYVKEISEIHQIMDKEFFGGGLNE